MRTCELDWGEWHSGLRRNLTTYFSLSHPPWYLPPFLSWPEICPNSPNHLPPHPSSSKLFPTCLGYQQRPEQLFTLPLHLPPLPLKSVKIFQLTFPNIRLSLKLSRPFLSLYWGDSSGEIYPNVILNKVGWLRKADGKWQRLDIRRREGSSSTCTWPATTYKHLHRTVTRCS